MNVSRSLVLLWTPRSVAISAALVIVGAGFCFSRQQRRSGYRRSVGALELLRWVIIAVAAIVLNQPEWVEEYRPEEKPLIAILWGRVVEHDDLDVAARGRRQGHGTKRSVAHGPGVVEPAEGADERGDPVVLAGAAVGGPT